MSGKRNKKIRKFTDKYLEEKPDFNYLDKEKQKKIKKGINRYMKRKGVFAASLIICLLLSSVSVFAISNIDYDKVIRAKEWNDGFEEICGLLSIDNINIFSDNEEYSQKAVKENFDNIIKRLKYLRERLEKYEKIINSCRNLIRN